MLYSHEKEWQAFAKVAPYYGVLTHPRYMGKRLERDTLGDFMASGEAHIEALITKYESAFGPLAQRSSALDFGCGVGRLAIPLARRFEAVTAVDIAPDIIKLAKQHSQEAGYQISGSCKGCRKHPGFTIS
jgi:2-polyprenyl-3-methyl-5-hydroxy-6-metoxy-1,4-benzoquinol methylase